MTVLALLELNPRSRAWRKASKDLQVMHSTIMSMYPDVADTDARRSLGVLWRIEGGDTPTVLVQSSDIPDIEGLPVGFASAVRFRHLDIHLDSLDTGHVVNYRTILNPIRTSRRDNAPGRRIVPFSERADWWAAKATRAGLDLLDTPAVATEQAREVLRNGKSFPLYSFRVDGIARIDNPDTLRAAIRTGIGRGKAWGCGLLTVARAQLPGRAA